MADPNLPVRVVEYKRISEALEAAIKTLELGDISQYIDRLMLNYNRTSGRRQRIRLHNPKTHLFDKYFLNYIPVVPPVDPHAHPYGHAWPAALDAAKHANLLLLGNLFADEAKSDDDISSDDFTSEEWEEIKCEAIKQYIESNLDTPEGHLDYIRNQITDGLKSCSAVKN